VQAHWLFQELSKKNKFSIAVGGTTSLNRKPSRSMIYGVFSFSGDGKGDGFCNLQIIQ